MSLYISDGESWHELDSGVSAADVEQAVMNMAQNFDTYLQYELQAMRDTIPSLPDPEASGQYLGTGPNSTWVLTDAPDAEVAWDEVSGKPATFPPSAHTHDEILAAIGDTDFDFAALYQTVPK